MTDSSRIAANSMHNVSPVMFVAGGTMAGRCLESLPIICEDLGITVHGLAAVIRIQSGTDDELHSEMKIYDRTPWGDPTWESASTPSRGDNQHLSHIRSALRHLRPINEGPKLELPGDHAINVYVVLDLSDEQSLTPTLDAIESLRQEHAALDITGIFLTGRTANYREDEETWIHRKREVEARSKESFLFHRVYFMDGKDAHQAWLQTEADHARMAAEFLVHHALAPYRHRFRSEEISRRIAAKPLEEVYGSFSCRILRNDRGVLSTAMFAALHKMLFQGDGYSLEGSGDEVFLDKHASDCADRIDAVMQLKPTKETPSVEYEKQIKDALAQSLASVCNERPLDNLPEFLRRLDEHVSARKVENFLRNEQDVRKQTGIRMKEWEFKSTTPSKIRVMIPSRTFRSTIAWVLLAVAWTFLIVSTQMDRFEWLVLGLEWFLLGFVVCGCAAAMCFLSDTEPHSFYPQIKQDDAADHEMAVDQLMGGTKDDESAGDEDVAANADEHRETYWRRLGVQDRVSGLLMLLIGTILLGASLDFQSTTLRYLDQPWISQWIPPIGLAWVLFALIAGAGLFFALQPCQMEDGNPDPEDCIDDDQFTKRLVGSAILVLAFLFMAIFIPTPLRQGPQWQLAVIFGSTIALGGIAFLSLTRGGDHAYTFLPRQVAQPKADIKFEEEYNTEADRLLARLHAWCGNVHVNVQSPHMELRRPYGTILDAVDEHWPDKLAAAREQEEAIAITDAQQWIDCLTDSYEKGTQFSDYQAEFARSITNRWLDGRNWSDLIRVLGKSDGSWLSWHIEHHIKPIWPRQVRQWDQDVAIIAMNPKLAEELGPLISVDEPYQIVPMNWKDPNTVAIVRRVQGPSEDVFDDGFEPLDKDESEPVPAA